MELYRYKKRLPLAAMLVCLVLSGNCQATGETDATGAEAQQYLTPEQITKDDYDMMSEYAYRYDSCLNETSMEQMDQMPDPRHVVDYAMKQCAAELEELDHKMTARNFDPAYRQGFIGKVNRQSVNNALRMVMVGMAARQSLAPAPAQ